MLKSYDELRKIDVKPYCETRWATVSELGNVY